MFDKIPEELKRINRWVCWKLVERDGRLTKIPFNPATGEPAMSNVPDTWSDFWTAHDKMMVEGYSGIGFVFNGDGIVGVDIDHCRDPETGEITELAKDIICTLDSYTELSQSGTGIHIICRGKLPKGRRKNEPVEMYETVRYFCMTGNVIDDGHMDIEERTDELAIVHEKYVNKKSRKNDTKKPQNVTETPVFVDDDKVIEIAMAAKNGDLFTDLMNGNWKGRYNSQSEADIALCNMLAFYTRCDGAQMQRIFRRSGLYRHKWDERRGEAGTYGEITIARAIEDCTEVYEPPKPKKTKAKQEEPPEIDLGLDHLGEPAPEELPEWIFGPYNDTWNAERLVEKYGKDIKYNTGKGWFVWNGKYWEEDKLGTVRRMVDETILSLYQYEDRIISKHGYDSRKTKDFISWLAKARNTGRKDNMLKEAQSWQGISALPDEFDRDIWLLNCDNGTIDLRTGKLKQHDKSDFITRIIPIKYDPDAKAPLWDKFLDEIFSGNSNIISFLQKAVGYSLTGSIKEQCMFILHGVGRNGKSTFLDTIRNMLGGYTRNANSSTFMRNESSNLNEIARLQGARFVTTTEPEEGERLSESLVKQATGGEPLTARYLYKEAFEYVPEFKLWMGTNHKPKISGSDLGIWRRIRLIPFDVIIPPEDVDPELPNKLKKELPGIFNWAMEGCEKWIKEGLNPPNEVLAAIDDYKGEMDALQVFLDECVEMCPDKSVRSGELYRVYENWCIQNGEYKYSSTKFALKLKERGYARARTRTMRCWEGMQLTPAGRKMLYTGQSSVPEDQYEQEELPW